MEFLNWDEMKNKSGIYIIVNKINNSTYVGQTKQRFQKRYWHHHWKLRNKSHDNVNLQSDWDLYGESNFYFKVIKYLNDFNSMNELEEFYVKHYRSLVFCYNNQDGGQKTGGYIRTDEIKKSIGEKNRVHMLGRKHSEESKRKMSESRSGKHYNSKNYKLTSEQAFQIKTMLVEGEKPSDISKKLNISYRFVNGILSNNTWGRVYVDGWDEFCSNRIKVIRFTDDDCVEVYKLYKNGNYTQTELANIYNKSRHTIANAIKRAKKIIID